MNPIDDFSLRIDESRAGRNRNALSRLDNRGSKGPSFGETLDRTMKQTGRHERETRKLRETCVEMESIFVGKMLKEMRNTVHKSDWLHGGYAEEIFEDMLYDEYALNVSRNSRLGLADMLYKEMSRNL